MSNDEFAAAMRERKRRKDAIGKGEYDLRIVTADKGRIEMNLAIDRAVLANIEADITARWQHPLGAQSMEMSA